MEYPSSNAQRQNNAPPPFVSPVPATPQDQDEINLLEYVYVLVKHKKTIAVLTLAGLVLGLIVALIKGPTWVAEAVIAPKETESQKASSLSSLGAIGGLVASQFNLSGNASLDKMDLILDSRDFSAKLINKYTFLPVIYRYQWPGQYRKYWDSAHKNWISTFTPPKLLGIGGYLNTKFLKKTKNAKSNTILLKFHSGDSAFTINLANMYVEYLNEYIKTDIQKEATENVAYLDTQLVSIADPLLREKILGLIANEIEKRMVVSKEAFKVIDPVYLYSDFKSKKLYPLISGFGLFFLACMAVVFMHITTATDRTEEGKNFLEKIKKEISPPIKSIKQ